MEYSKIIIWIVWFIWGLISKIIYDIYESHKKWLIDENEFDKKIYIKIKDELLPLNWSIWLLKDNNFSYAYKFEVVSDLFNIADNYLDHPEIKFLNKKSERLKNELFILIKEFVLYLSWETYPNNIGYEVPRELEIQDYEKFESIVSKIHDYTDNIWKKYNNFMDYWRKKFKV